jgi:hypothetical protein
MCSAAQRVDRRGGGEGGKPVQSTDSPEGRPGPIMHMILSFSIVSHVIRQWSLVLMSIAATSHLAYDALCFVSALLPLATPPLLRNPKKFFHWGPKPLPATLPVPLGKCYDSTWNRSRPFSTTLSLTDYLRILLPFSTKYGAWAPRILNVGTR